jgi:hydroxyacylglutathione hydrolase
MGKFFYNGVHVSPIRVTNPPFFINYSYVVYNPSANSSIIIDPAWEPEKIEQVLVRSGTRPGAILLTHSHTDHTHLADYFARKYNCDVWMSAREIATYRFSAHNLRAFQDDQVIHAAGLAVQALVTPGHTSGSACYLIGNNLFSGDTLFIEGCGMCEGEGADPGEMYSTIMRLKAILKNETRIYPGHSFVASPGEDFEYTLQNNIYLHFKEEEKFVEFRMRKKQKNWFEFK